MAPSLEIRPKRKEAFRLLHEGSQVLARAEHAGIRIDTEYCEKERERISRRIRKEVGRLEGTDLVKTWRGKYGEKTNLDSSPQLRDILYNEMGYEPVRITKKDNPSVDKDALEELGIPEVDQLIGIRRLQKMKNTYFENILRETVDGFLHPFFNLHSVITYRSSSSRPNFQNIPTRDPEIGKIIRRAFIPRPGRQILEVDYSGIEVCIATCYHQDPTMLQYLGDKTKDMHRDMAMDLYLLEQEEVSKPTRYSAKNGFVFPEFYGDYFVDCAQQLWKNIQTLKLETKRTGIPLKKHLANKGIKSYRAFENHVKKVEKHFWERRFSVYSDWKDDWVSQYEKRGWLDTLTGFRCSGVMKKNEIINYPIQGSAFHCLLWSLIEVDKMMRYTKMKSQIIGQIHDSILFDCDPNEVRNLLILTNYIMCEKIREAWDWIMVDLDIEAEITPINGAWSEKKETEIPMKGGKKEKELGGWTYPRRGKPLTHIRN